MTLERSARKTRVLLLAVVLVLGLAASARAAVRQGTLEFFWGSYNIKEPLFAEIYKPGGTMRGLILSSSLFFNIDFYLEIKAMFKTGQLSYSLEKTDFLLLPVSLGLRYVHPFPFVLPYVGGGLDFFLFYESNPIGTVFNYVRGYHVLGGAYIQPSKKVPLMLNLRFKYSKAPYAINDERTIELGGTEYGLGFVVAF